MRLNPNSLSVCARLCFSHISRCEFEVQHCAPEYLLLCVRINLWPRVQNESTQAVCGNAFRLARICVCVCVCIFSERMQGASCDDEFNVKCVQHLSK